MTQRCVWGAIAAWVCGSLLGSGVVLAQPETDASGSETGAARARSVSVSRFQRPAAERRVDAGGQGDNGPARRRAADLPENLEERLYLRERPDALGAAAREHQSESLQRLLRSREKLAVQRRDEAIRLLEVFVRREPKTAREMPDALLRLAELRWEQARSQYLRAFAAWQKRPERRRGAAPKPRYGRSMQLYDRILRDHRDFDRYDLVLYMKAYAFLEAGEGEQALALYRKILAEFPRSQFVPDAHFALAEDAFTSRYDYAGALAEYEKVLKFRDSELYDIALFKSAWCMWRSGRSRAAARRFRQVLDLSRKKGRMTVAQRRRLRELQEEALDYLIQVFIEDPNNNAADVFRFLQDIGGEQYARRVLTRLSDTYMGQARYEEAVDAYGMLLEMDPTAADAPLYQAEIVSAYAAMGDPAKTIAELTKLAKTYRASGQWASQQSDPEVVEETTRRVERIVRRQGLKYHEGGQKEDQRPLLESAVKTYRVYLKHFPRTAAAYEIRFYLGEILFHRLKRYPEAGEAYVRAAKARPKGRFTKDALYNAIGAFEHVREQEVKTCARGESTRSADSNQGRSAGRCGETENDRKFAQAIELYVELFPNDPDLPEILFRQGRLYYDRGIYDPAVRLFGQLLERFPNSQYANPAGELILDSFNRAEDYANIEAWARRLKSAPAFSSAENQKRLDKLVLQSIFKVGEQLAARGAHADAAAAYLRAATEFPKDERAPQAYYNAGVERQRAGNLGGAAEAYDLLIERHPGHSVGAKGAWAAAQMYESIAQFGDAAGYYERYGARYPSAPKAKDAMYNAVLLRLTQGDHQKAVTAGEGYLQRYGKTDEADDVFFFIGRAHEENEAWNDAAQTYRGYIRRSKNLDRRIEAQTRLALVLIEAGRRKQADRALSDAVRLGRRHRSRLQDGLYYAAQARYLQGDQILARYSAIEIAGDPDTIGDRLRKKSELLKEAALVYADVVSFNVAQWNTASLFQIGRSYELFAESMREFEVPEGLNEEEEAAYRDQLAMFIVPMEERALEAYEGGYAKALELRIFNRYTAQLHEALTRLNDVQYPPLREVGAETVGGAPLKRPPPLAGLHPSRMQSSGKDEGATKKQRKAKDRNQNQGRSQNRDRLQSRDEPQSRDEQQSRNRSSGRQGRSAS